MAVIVELKPRLRASKVVSAGEAFPGFKLLFFTGVRYERITDNCAKPDAVRMKSERRSHKTGSNRL